jgi:LuxR family maltose regulon positive regulatory protein
LPPSHRLADQLTGRERELLRVLSAGASYDEAAARLGVSINTVRTHVRALYRKLGVTSKLEAVMSAMRLGILSPT